VPKDLLDLSKIKIGAPHKTEEKIPEKI